jgi:hypothetical protein
MQHLFLRNQPVLQSMIVVIVVPSRLVDLKGSLPDSVVDLEHVCRIANCGLRIELGLHADPSTMLNFPAQATALAAA